MPKTIQIRNVPDEQHRALKARASSLGMTLSDYLLSEIEQVAAKPTIPATSARPLSPLRFQLRRPGQRLEHDAVLFRLAPQVI